MRRSLTFVAADDSIWERVITVTFAGLSLIVRGVLVPVTTTLSNPELVSPAKRPFGEGIVSGRAFEEESGCAKGADMKRRMQIQGRV